MFEMSDVTSNGVATTAPTAEKVPTKKRAVRAAATAVENPAREAFGHPTHGEETSRPAGKKPTKKPHKVSASPKKKPKAKASSAKKPVKAKATSKASHASKKHGGKKKHASAVKKTPAKRGQKKRPGHWTDTKAQLVLHATPQLVDKLDRALTRLGKKFKLDRATRGSVIRALVEQAVK